MQTRSTTTPILLAVAMACDRGGVSVATARGSESVPRVVINEIMANPQATPDERGEWIELRSMESQPVDLRGWTVASGNDRPVTIDRSVLLAPGGVAVLARADDRAATGGAPAYVYGPGIALGNNSDWIAVRLPDGRTVDSVAWTSTASGVSRALLDASAPHADAGSSAWGASATRLASGDAGTPGRPNESLPNVAVAPSEAATATPAAGLGPATLGAAARDSTLTVRVLDVGQGDAILVENGGSRVLVDGGPDMTRFGQLLGQLGIDGGVIDAVILTHQHYDHYAGLRELFRSRRGITVRYVFENKDPYSNPSLAQLRDSIIARARRGQLVYRDTDDPCGTGAPSCTITMRGGARLQVLRPDPNGDGPNNRSAAVRLLAPDSSRFTMWLAGDAERQEITWFDATDYDRTPGMRATVLKGDHHGSCDGISPRYLDLVRPQIVALSLEAVNDYGYVHSQTLDLLARRRIPWYRTDQNGTITITVPPRATFKVSVERGTASMRGPSDRPARSCGEDDRGRR
jgi:competence protein ComEC